MGTNTVGKFLIISEQQNLQIRSGNLWDATSVFLSWGKFDTGVVQREDLVQIFFYLLFYLISR